MAGGFHARGVRFRAALAVYGGGLLLGLVLVSLPASSAVIASAHGFSSRQYGSLFLSQLIGALAGGIGVGVIGGRIGIRTLLLVAIASLTAAALLLSLSQSMRAARAYLALMTAMTCVGLGIGIGGGPLNAYPVLLFPRLSSTALTAIHVTVGVGMMASPLYHAFFASHGLWATGLLGLTGLGAGLFALTLSTGAPISDERPSGPADAARTPGKSAFIWLLIAMAVLYSVAEGVFSNWAILFLQQARGLSSATASLALTAFLGCLTLGRVFASFLVVRIPPSRFLVVLPVAMAAAFVLLPHIGSPGGAITAFGFAGFACSAYFPMLIAHAAGRFPDAVAWIATMMISAQMVGVGVGTYGLAGFVGQVPFDILYPAAIAFPVATLILLIVARAAERRSAIVQPA